MTSQQHVSTMFDSLETLLAEAESRETFDCLRHGDVTPRTVRLSDGPAGVSIVGIPSVEVLSGPHQFLEFAKGFRGKRRVVALSIPGFVQGEPLPASMQAVVQVEADAIGRSTDSRATVVAGICSGGALAYAVARHLEAVGGSVAGVVLFDSYQIEPSRRFWKTLVQPLYETNENQRFFTQARLTAMAWYGKLCMDWNVEPIAAPTLLVRATEPAPHMDVNSAWHATWPYEPDVIDVPGNHWTMLSEHAGSTADAIDKWIRDAASEVAL